MAPPLLTVGHGSATAEGFGALLRAAGVMRLVDIRRYPGSRAHPHFGREALAGWLPAAGVDYRWEGRMGGRRRLVPGATDNWWQVAAFAAYAAHMRTAEFTDAAAELARDVEAASTAVMCSESLWWRCHRRLVADYFVLVQQTRVSHLGHDGRLTDHRGAEGARLADGELRYDLAPTMG